MNDNRMHPVRLDRRGALIGAAAALVAVSPGSVQARVKTGTVEMEQIQIAFIGSGNLGSGALHFQGKSYPITVGGLGVGGFGVSKLQALGDVYDLQNLRQFPGAYAQARMGVAVADRSTGQLWLQNAHGVVLSLKTRREGLALSLGADGVVIDFK